MYGSLCTKGFICTERFIYERIFTEVKNSCSCNSTVISLYQNYESRGSEVTLQHCYTLYNCNYIVMAVMTHCICS